MARSPTSAFLAAAAFYLVFALSTVLAFVLAQFGWIGAIPNLYWLRIHALTIGVLAQSLLGILPGLFASRSKSPAPPPWALWTVFVLLNSGLLLLELGQVSVTAWPIHSGGILLLAAVTAEIGLLIWLWRRSTAPRPAVTGFYLAAPGFLLLGVLMALTLLLGWWSPVGYQATKESHIHANIFGFTGLAVAGLALDRLPALFGRTLARPQWIKRTLWLMVVGALALWLGPYVGVIPIMAGGLLLYVTGLLLMLANFFLTTHRPRPVRIVNGAQVLISYIWIAAPVVATLAFVLFGADRVPLAKLEAGVTQGLVYGWILQLVLALLPLAVSRIRTGDTTRVISHHEGSWFTLILLNLAVAVVWLASILLPWPVARPLVAIGYLLLIVAALPALLILWRAFQTPRTVRLPVADARP
jgi:hypothetical protein